MTFYYMGQIADLSLQNWLCLESDRLLLLTLKCIFQVKVVCVYICTFNCNDGSLSLYWKTTSAN